MAELTTTAETTANSCCAPEAQATCCEPSAKAECCDPSHGEGCGCAANTSTAQAGDVREQVRERYAAAAAQVPGADHLFDPQALYRQWEDSQWSPWEFDLAADRDQSEAMDNRSLAVFVLGSLMVAEERITTKFSGLVGADGSGEEVTFLATQQVDEARHMQFYARHQDEVVSEPARIAEHVKRAREHVSPRFRRSLTTSSSPRTIACSPIPATWPPRSRS